MELDAIRAAAAITFLLVASFFDLFNRKNVPIWVPGGMLVTGAIITLATGDVGLIIQSFAVAAGVFSIGYLIYRIGQIGGADVLVFAAISLLLPVSPAPLFSTNAPLFPYPPVVPILTLSGLFGMIGLAVRYIPVISKRMLSGELKPEAGKAILYFVSIIGYAIVLAAFLYYGKFSPFQAASVLVLVLLAGFLTLFRDEISRSMVEYVPLSGIDEEDVIQLSLMDPLLVKKLDLQPVLTPREVEKLKKTNLKLFPVFKGMPAFLPYVLLATVVYLFFGDPLALFFS